MNPVPVAGIYTTHDNVRKADEMLKETLIWANTLSSRNNPPSRFILWKTQTSGTGLRKCVNSTERKRGSIQPPYCPICVFTKDLTQTLKVVFLIDSHPTACFS